MPRPGDWDVLGLDGDPVPGDPDRLDRLAASLGELGRVAREIDDALGLVLVKTGDGAWIGQTAEALREKIEGRLRDFVRSVAEGFEASSRALSAYVAVMREQQGRADGALNEGRGLAADDVRRQVLAGTARQAGAALAEAGTSCAATVEAAGAGIKQPVSDCELFWEVFQWLAIILIVPALVVGGPVALFAIGVNLTVFIKMAVDFANGRAGILDLFLSGLGMVAPTTKAIPIVALVKTAVQLSWRGLRGVGPVLLGVFRGLSGGGVFRGVAFLPGLRGFAAVAGSWIRSGSLWVMTPLTRVPSFTALVRGSGLVVIQGIQAVPGAIRSLSGLALRGAAAGWGLAGRAAGASWGVVVSQLGGAKAWRLVLPVDAGEVGRFGFREALRLGVVERGLMGRNVFGAPLIAAGGDVAAVVPAPSARPVSSLLDLPGPDLARLRAGDWSGMRALDLAGTGPAGPGGSGAGLAAPAHFGVHTAFGDGMQFGPAAVRRLDALLDTPVQQVNGLRIGEWATGGWRQETQTGMSVQAGGTLGHGSAFAGTGAPVHALDLHTPAASQTVTGLHTPAAQTVTGLHTPVTSQTMTGLHAGPHPTSAQITGSTVSAAVPATGRGAVANDALELLSPSSMNRADTPVFGAGAHLAEPATQAKTAHNITLGLHEYPSTPSTTGSARTAPPPTPVSGSHGAPPSSAFTHGPLSSTTSPAPPASPPSGVAPAGMSAASHAGGAANRVDSAFGLLEHGRGNPGSPALAGAPARAGAEDLVPRAGASSPGTVLATATTSPSRPTDGTSAGTPPRPADGASTGTPSPASHGPGPARTTRLTGEEIERLWNEEADAVRTIFGHADDPARPARIRTWRRLVHARDEQARASGLVHHIDTLIGELSTTSPLHLRARQALDAADLRVQDTLDRLTALGVDIADTDRRLIDLAGQSVRGRPRLIGAGTSGTLEPAAPPQVPGIGAAQPPAQAGPRLTASRFHPTTLGTYAYHPPAGGTPWPATRTADGFRVTDPDGAYHLYELGHDGKPAGTAVPLADPVDPATPWLHIRTAGPTAKIVDHQGRPVPGHTTTPTANGWRVNSPGGSHFRDALGNRVAETVIPLRGLAGDSLRLSIRDADGAPPELRVLATGSDGPPPAFSATLHRSGHYQVTDSLNSAFTLHTVDGELFATGTPLHAAAHVSPGHFAVFRPGAKAGYLENARHELQFSPEVTRRDGHIRLAGPTKHSYDLFDARTGRLVENAVHLRDDQGVILDALFHTRYGDDGEPLTLQLVDSDGNSIDHFTVTRHHSGHHKVTNSLDGTFTRYTPKGEPHADGTPLRAADGAPDGTYALFRPGTTTGHLENALGQPLAHRSVTIVDGYLWLDGPGHAYSLHTRDGRLVERAVPLRGPEGDLPGTLFRTRYGDDGHPPVVQVVDTDIRPVGHLSVTPHRSGHHKVTSGIDGSFTVHTTDGELFATGTPLRPSVHTPESAYAVFRPGTTARHLEDAKGRPLFDRNVTRDDGLIRVDGPGNAYQLFDAGGRRTEEVLPLRSGEAADRLLRISHPGGGAPPTVQVVDGGLAPVPGHTVTARGGHYWIAAPDGSYRAVSPRHGHATESVVLLRDDVKKSLGQRLHTTFSPDSAPPAFKIYDGNDTPLDHLVTVERRDGLLQIENTIDRTVTLHSPNGVRYGTRTPLRAPDDALDETFVVFRSGALNGHVEDAAGNVLPRRAVTRAADTGVVQVAFDIEGSARHGEFRRYAPDGTLTHSGVNVLNNGERTGFQYVVDHAAKTWNRQAHPDAAPPRPETGVFHHGRAEFSAGGRDVRLLTSIGNPVEVFARRTHPSGGVLDAFRRTDSVAFSVWTRRTTWVHWDDTGAMVAHGTRKYDISGVAWWDADERGKVVHHGRDSLHKGTILAVRQDGGWRWHRFDASGRELAHGVRTMDRDGGWTDTLPSGEVVQRRWGPWHGPKVADHYLEYGWDTATGTRAGTWQSRSKNGSVGKDVGTREILPDGGVLTSTRWSEQRPPAWLRRAVFRHLAPPEDSARYLKSDNHFAIFTWTKEGGEGAGGGLRYVGLDWRYYDLDAGGRLVRASGKLPGGEDLKVGDLAARPDHDPPDAGGRVLPWQAGEVKGYRMFLDPGADTAWRDVYRERADGPWLVARQGFADGSVRDYHIAPRMDPETGRLGQVDVPWIQRDAHGNLTGQQNVWTDSHGVSHRVTATGGAYSPDWTWESTPVDGGAASTGRRLHFRGSRDVRLPWDDSFRDFDAGGALIRQRNMLSGGGYVDAWRETDGTWRAGKFDADGGPVAFDDGRQVRQWWDRATRAWTDRRVGDAAHFRDVLRPGTGGPVVLREVPPHLSAQDGPLRVREYVPGGGDAGTPGAWKEFDHGDVVRRRTALGDGRFLEQDLWRGQWRLYDDTGQILAQRTDRGLVFERGSNGRLRLTGDEYDFRGHLTDLRGWGRGLREANRLPWSGTVKLNAARYRDALDGVPGLPETRARTVNLGEAAYMSYKRVLLQKVLVEVGQEFVLDFGTSLAINGFTALATDKEFTGDDALRSLTTAVVGVTVKTAIGTAIHDVRGSWAGQWKTGWGNLDENKHPRRRPFSHGDTWANEWAGNEAPMRWRVGTYDFAFTATVAPISGFVNGSILAAVWGVPDANGERHVVKGGAALVEGGLYSAGAFTSAAGLSVLRNVFILGAGSRFFHRKGFFEFWAQVPFRLVEKEIFFNQLMPAFRDRAYDNDDDKGAP